MLVSCPACQLEGELPDDGESDGTLTCPRCTIQFEQPKADPRRSIPAECAESISVGWPDPPPPGTRTVTSETGDGMSVWVGVESSPAITPAPVRNLALDAFASEPGRGPTPSSAPPEEITADNAAAHVDWIQKEVDRFNRFVTLQLDLIQKTRLDLARADAQLTAAMLTREQELNREKANLIARASGLDRREAEIAEQRTELELRMLEVERLEQSVQRKMDEAEEIEETLRLEFEEREREVERQRQTVEESSQVLRSRTQASAQNSTVANPELIESLRSILRNLETRPDSKS